MGEPNKDWVCRGSYALGTACGRCAKCDRERWRLDRLTNALAPVVDTDDVLEPGLQAIVDDTLDKIRAAFRENAPKLCVVSEGSFSWALEQMKAGKKVRRACWKEHEWWALHKDGVIVLHDGDLVLEIPTIQALATDWTLHEEPEG